MSREPWKLLVACESRRLMAASTKWYLPAGRANGDPVGLWLHFDDGSTVSVQVTGDRDRLGVTIDLPSRSVDMGQAGRIEVNQQVPGPLQELLGKRLDAVRGMVDANDDLNGLKLCLEDVELILLGWRGVLRIDTRRPHEAATVQRREVNWNGSPNLPPLLGG
jgi:hypothetical protein